MTQHLVFYDGECNLCDRAVQFILERDRRGLFVFAPLKGQTAEKTLQKLPQQMKDGESIILIEAYQSPGEKIYSLGKAALRICWLLGGVWAIPGILFWLPSVFYDWAYRHISINRHRLFTSRCILKTPETKNRFLP